MAKKFSRSRVGDVRGGQLVHTYGVGSIIDLPNISAMMMGLDSWGTADWDPNSARTAIPEERLLRLVRSHLGGQVERLCGAPIPEGGNDVIRDPYNPVGAPIAPFPRWVRCPRCDLLAPLDFGVFELKTNPYQPDRARYVHANCPRWSNAPAVIPARFVFACEHLSDFPWHAYIRHANTECRGPLRLSERGVSTEAADLWLTCDGCNQQKPMAQAFGRNANLPPCPGQHPHLGPKYQAPCTAEKSKAMLAGASNLWFPLSISALSLPADVNELPNLLEEHWPVLQEVEDLGGLKLLRKIGQLQPFSRWTDEELWEALGEKNSGSTEEEEPLTLWKIKVDEWEMFSNPAESPSTKDFRLTEVGSPKGYESLFSRVVLVERLRIVKALIGFTRIGSPGDFGDATEMPKIRRAPLGRSLPKWVPASEVRGEGIFLQIDNGALEAWLKEPSVQTRVEELLEAHYEFRRARNITPAKDDFEAGRFGLLHTLSHALIRQFAIECGYSAASIEERIYAADSSHEDGPMTGILLFTAAADSEGTLGGLVALGDPEVLGRHLDQALERARLCSSDPLCSEHEPVPDGRTLHGAACHACTFVSETSCERGNKYLDRSFLVETISSACTPFFGGRSGD